MYKMSLNVYLPRHILNRIKRLTQATHKLYEEFGQNPTDQQLAEQTGMSPGKTHELIINRKEARDCSIAIKVK